MTSSTPGADPQTGLRPIFVVGAARSGTTLLQSMIDAHPDIALVGELHFFDQILRLRETIPEPVDRRAIEPLRQGILTCHASRFVPDIDRALDLALPRLATAPRPTYGLLFRLLLEAFAELRGAGRVGEKTPTNVRYLAEIVELFPDARVVHILRDPRDSISSRVRYPFSSPSVIFNTLLWKIEMIYAFDFRATEKVGDGRYLEVHYEALVQDTEQQLRRICRFIDVHYAAKMLAGHRRADRVVRGEPWKAGVGEPVNRRSVDAWQQRLTPAQVGLIEALGGACIEQSGYQRIATAGRPRLVVEALHDVLRYVPYKLRTSWRARREERAGTTIGSESSKITSMLWRALRS
ncbi:MAG: sulfotransferase [Geminicoccaceae bacterium]